jgi:hypothetical protein
MGYDMKMRIGEVIQFLDGTFGVSLCDYHGGDDEVSTVSHFDTAEELLEAFPDAAPQVVRLQAEYAEHEDERRAELARLQAESAAYREWAEKNLPDVGF